MTESYKPQTTRIKYTSIVMFIAVVFYSFASFEKETYFIDSHKSKTDSNIILDGTFFAINSCISFSERNCFTSFNYFSFNKFYINHQTFSVSLLKKNYVFIPSTLLQNKFINIPPPLS